MHQTQPVGENDKPEDVAARLDAQLLVREWVTPFDGQKIITEDIDRDAPYWWRGEEEASQAFLAAQGVVL